MSVNLLLLVAGADELQNAVSEFHFNVWVRAKCDFERVPRSERSLEMFRRERRRE